MDHVLVMTGKNTFWWLMTSCLASLNSHTFRELHLTNSPSLPQWSHLALSRFILKWWRLVRLYSSKKSQWGFWQRYDPEHFANLRIPECPRRFEGTYRCHCRPSREDSILLSILNFNWYLQSPLMSLGSSSTFCNGTSFQISWGR